VKNNISLLAIIVAISIAACVDPIVSIRHNTDNHENHVKVEDRPYTDISLITGRMTLSGEVKETDNKIGVNWAEGIAYLQVIADVKLGSYDNSTFLRVIFSSDRSEWIGMGGLGYDVYDFEEDCIKAENHCDEVIPGEGVGGVFESSTGVYTAVVNTHCSASIYDYDYNVYAYVVDFSGVEPVYVSETATVNITCIQY